MRLISVSPAMPLFPGQSTYQCRQCRHVVRVETPPEAAQDHPREPQRAEPQHPLQH